MSFTVVTVLHDSAAVLPALLRSLAEHAPDAPVVAVDAGSRDGGPELARERGTEVVALGANPGFGAANNAGIERVGTPVTVLLNPDCELLDGSLARLAEVAAARDALVVPRLLNADGSLQRSAHPLPGTLGSLLPALVHPPLLPGAVRDRAEPWRAARGRTVGWAIAACMAARTDTLRSLGPFDPRQFLFYEDMDLCLRARLRGIPTVLDPSVGVRHAGAHATARAYGGEPHDLLARRRRAVIEADLGPRARRIDDTAQALTFATRAAARLLLGGTADRERAQLRAVLRGGRER